MSGADLPADSAPLAEFALVLQARFLDETGEPRHVHDTLGAYAYETAADHYAALHNTADPIHRRWYELTGEHGLDLALITQLGIGSGTGTVMIAAAPFLSPDEVKKLASRARKSEAARIHTFPGFVYFGLPVGRAEAAATFSIELICAGRVVCIRKIELTLPVDDARTIAGRLVSFKAQVNGLGPRPPQWAPQ